MNDLQELKQKAHALDPIVRIGKAGLTDTVVDEVKLQLKKRRLIKIKLLRSCVEERNKNDIAAELAEKTGAEIVSTTGLTIVLFK